MEKDWFPNFKIESSRGLLGYSLRSENGGSHLPAFRLAKLFLFFTFFLFSSFFLLSVGAIFALPLSLALASEHQLVLSICCTPEHHLPDDSFYTGHGLVLVAATQRTPLITWLWRPWGLDSWVPWAMAIRQFLADTTPRTLDRPRTETRIHSF